MKKLFVAILMLLSIGLSQTASAANLFSGTGPEIKFVVTPQRIWVLADETIFKLPVTIKDAAGKVVLEKEFTAKCADWSLSLEGLAAGSYTVHVKGEKMTSFKK
jgi:hypothetical protein